METYSNLYATFSTIILMLLQQCIYRSKLKLFTNITCHDILHVKRTQTKFMYAKEYKCQIFMGTRNICRKQNLLSFPKITYKQISSKMLHMSKLLQTNIYQKCMWRYLESYFYGCCNTQQTNNIL